MSEDDPMLVFGKPRLHVLHGFLTRNLDVILATETVCTVDVWVLNGRQFNRGDRVILTVANAKRFEALGRCRILPESEWTQPTKEPPHG
jgi:hypothetical protein